MLILVVLPGRGINTCFDEKRTWLGQEPEKVVSVTLEPNSVYEIAVAIFI
jgi:hypothetical protein